MKLYPEQIYHIYNRGNNKQQLFFTRRNYLHFREKLQIHISQYCDILSYCLMPNHFHLMILTGESFDNREFGNNFKILLSSYTRAINKQNNTTGSLFQQNSKAKCLSSNDAPADYALICFNYIHQNPLRAGLVKKMEDWEFSSFKDYLNLRKNSICNIQLCRNVLGLSSNIEEFYKIAYDVINKEKIEILF